jgi:hypothetical protein
MRIRPRPSSTRTADGPAMGFNATRRYRDAKIRDIILLIVAAVIIVGLIAWAMGAF